MQGFISYHDVAMGLAGLGFEDAFASYRGGYAVRYDGAVDDHRFGQMGLDPEEMLPEELAELTSAAGVIVDCSEIAGARLLGYTSRSALDADWLAYAAQGDCDTESEDQM